MNLFFLIFLIFLISLLLPTVDSTVLVTPEKEIISALNEAIVLTMKIDEIPRDNMIIVQIFDSTGYMFTGGQPVPVDNNGIAKIDFRGIHEPIVGGIYTVVITGVDENNEIIKDTGQFSIGLKDKRDYAEKNVSNIQESEDNHPKIYGYTVTWMSAYMDIWMHGYVKYVWIYGYVFLDIWM